MKALFLCTTFAVAACAAAVVAGAEGTAPEEGVFPGDPIIITALAEPARESEVPFGVTALSPEDLRSLEVTNVAEALVRAEGVAVRKYGGVGANATVSLRGGFAKQTLVMVDGQPLNSLQGGDVDFNAISLEDIARVEVMPGASSALFGANATAGVVNIITRGAPAAPTLTLRGGYGTYGEIDSELSAAAPLAAGFGLRAGGNFRRAAGFRENDDFEGKGGHAKVSYELGEGRSFSLRGQYQRSELGVPGPLSYPSPNARQADDYLGANGGFEGPVAGPLSTSAHIFYKLQKRDYRDPDYGVADNHRTATFGGRLVNFYQLVSWNRLAAGGEFEHGRTASTVIGDVWADSWGVFAQDDVRLGAFTTVAGVRYDRSGRYGAAVSPRLGVRYRFSDFLSARAAAGRSFRAPTFDELFWPPDPVWGGGGNPDLRPEYCWSYEVGPTFSWREHLRFELTAFRADYADLIDGWPPANVGRAVVQGGEAAVTARPVAALPALVLSLTGTVLAGEDRETGEQLDYRPRFTSFAELRFTRYFLGEALALTPSFSAELVGRQQYTYTDPTTFETYKRWFPAYTLLHGRLAARVYYPEFYVAVKNIGDTRYQTVYDYPMPGRTFKAGMTLTL